jgi:hypothetical protein
MTREVIEEEFILDDSGFIINKYGDILPTYEDEEGVFSIINDKRIPLRRFQYRGIKYLKSKDEWKTYVKSSSVEINDNKSFKTEEEAARYVNLLYVKYGLDRIKNVIPIRRKK